MKPAISPAGQGRQIRVGPNTITYRTTAAESDGRIGVIDYQVGPGFVAPSVLHWHTKESWTRYVFEGRLRFRFAEGATAEVGPGDVIHVPVRTPFAWENESADQRAQYPLHVYAGWIRELLQRHRRSLCRESREGGARSAVADHGNRREVRNRELRALS